MTTKPKQPPSPEFETFSQFSERTGISPHTLKYWMTRTTGPRLPTYRPGKRRLVKISEALAFIEKTRQGGDV